MSNHSLSGALHYNCADVPEDLWVRIISLRAKTVGKREVVSWLPRQAVVLVYGDGDDDEHGGDVQLHVHHFRGSAHDGNDRRDDCDVRGAP